MSEHFKPPTPQEACLAAWMYESRWNHCQLSPNDFWDGLSQVERKYVRSTLSALGGLPREVPTTPDKRRVWRVCTCEGTECCECDYTGRGSYVLIDELEGESDERSRAQAHQHGPAHPWLRDIVMSLDDPSL